MHITLAVAAVLVVLVLLLVGVTRVSTSRIERRNPPVGSFIDVDGVRVHYVHVPSAGGDLPPVVFIHGASSNLKDQMLPVRPLLEGRAEMLFYDRPGYGWSGRGDGNGTPDAQARRLAALMQRLGIGRAVIVGHSFGAAVATAFALDFPDRTAGLVYLSAATHPWPGGTTSWYYHLATMPVIGRLFTETLSTPAGGQRMAAATDCVFAPNVTPRDYLARASIELVLRPAAFRANAADVESLYPYATANASRYRRIAAPTVVISGDRDTVVYEEIHSVGLAHDIPGAALLWVKNLGHKSDWIAPDLVVAAIEKVAGKPVDLGVAVAKVEARIAGDRQGEGVCVDLKAPETELSPP